MNYFKLVQESINMKPKNKTFFTSDLHFNDDRMNLYGRDLIFNNVDEMNKTIINNHNKVVKPDDLVYILGDITTKKDGLHHLNSMNGRKFLIKGNYDSIHSDEELKKYFIDIADEITIAIKDDNGNIIRKLYLNHYPTNGVSDKFNIVGHIHGTWKVQRNMINVGTDAWHFTPIDLDMINFQINGIQNHYDQNVFAGELEANLRTNNKTI